MPRRGRLPVCPEDQPPDMESIQFSLGRSPSGAERASIMAPATNVGTRTAVGQIAALAARDGVPGTDINQLEIVLAEVLNNIVEHAYADRDDGTMEIIVDLEAPGMRFEIWDEGQPMPAGRLPRGSQADPDRAGFEQEEGGYGLHLIRHLARKLRYERVGARNRLSFRMALGRM